MQPIIILVETQLGENIGMCARAMLNCGLSELRLVNPRDGWPNPAAAATAADADMVLEKAACFSSLKDALADCQRVFATTARMRSRELAVLDAEEAAEKIRSTVQGDQKTAILFGPEASGLDNAAIDFADTLIRFPTNPEFSSLNLAQAVLLFSWEWKRTVSGPPAEAIESPRPAEKRSLDGFLHRLEQSLEESGFFLTPELKPVTLQNLRSFFARSTPTEKELALLHGALTALKKQANRTD